MSGDLTTAEAVALWNKRFDSTADLARAQQSTAAFADLPEVTPELRWLLPSLPMRWRQLILADQAEAFVRGELSEAIQQRDDARALLRELEWSATDAYNWASSCGCCPECGGWKPTDAMDERSVDWQKRDAKAYRATIGHTPDCKLAAAIGEGR